MSGLTFIWIYGLISTAFCFSFSNIQTNGIDRTVQLGTFLNIGQNVEIKAYSVVGSYVSIAPNTLIDEHSMIGAYTQIANNCHIDKNVNIATFAGIGSSSRIGSGTNVGSYCAIQSNAKIGSMVLMNGYSKVGNSAQQGDHSILDKYSAVDDAALVMPKGYIGKYSSVGRNSKVGESAVILGYVNIPSGENIKPNEVIVQSPSSYDLYRECDSNYHNMITKTTPSSSGSISAEFNSQMEQSIDEQMNRLLTNCAQSNDQMRPTSLPQIISMYLNELHGTNRFKEYVQLVKQNNGGGITIGNVGLGSNVVMQNGQLIINGMRMDSSAANAYQSTISQLMNEYHFVENSRKILEPKTENKLVQLLAFDQDVVRDVRVQGDTTCKMLEQIHSGRRNVRCAKP